MFIGIDGPGCAGKSRLADDLRQHYEQLGLPACVVPINNFCNPKAIRYSGSADEGLDVYRFNFDYQALQTALNELAGKGRRKFSHNCLNAASDQYDVIAEYVVDDGGVVIVEGVHALRSELRRWYDIALFLTVSDEEQLRRALVRDVSRGNSMTDIERKYNCRYRPSFEHYIKMHEPTEYANFVVDNNLPEAPTWTTRSKC